MLLFFRVKEHYKAFHMKANSCHVLDPKRQITFSQRRKTASGAWLRLPELWPDASLVAGLVSDSLAASLLPLPLVRFVIKRY